MKVTLFIASLPEDNLEKRQFPLGPGFIQSYVQRELPATEFCITASPDKVLESEPDLVGISSVSQCFPAALSLARRVKGELDVPILLGGYHIGCFPTSLPAECDVGVIGEGEATTARLIELYSRAGRFETESCLSIPGICFHGPRGEVVTTGPSAPIHPIDDLPFPTRNISRGARNIHIFTSRGCVYRCQFCASNRFWKKFRAHSAEYVVSQLHALIEEYDATSVHLLDDLFFARRKRVREIADRMEREGLLGKLAFDGFIASSLADREMLEIAKRIGFRAIKFGAETGSARLLKLMKGPQASVDHHQRCIDLCHEMGIEARASFMFGTPGETIEDIEETYAFLRRNASALKVHGLYLTTPIPGTPYWDFAHERGLVSEDMDWSRLNLDFLKDESFDPSRAIYLNEDNVPLSTTLDYIRTIQSEFTFHRAA